MVKVSLPFRILVFFSRFFFSVSLLLCHSRSFDSRPVSFASRIIRAFNRSYGGMLRSRIVGKGNWKLGNFLISFEATDELGSESSTLSCYILKARGARSLLNCEKERKL